MKQVPIRTLLAGIIGLILGCLMVYNVYHRQQEDEARRRDAVKSLEAAREALKPGPLPGKVDSPREAAREFLNPKKPAREPMP